MKTFTKWVFTAALLWYGQAFAEFEFDPAHSKLQFTVEYMMFSDVSGVFDDVKVNLKWNEKDLSKSSVEVVIKAASINTQHQKRDNHLKSPDFFDVEKYPEITFKSTKIEKKGDGYQVSGKLTMKDVTKKISFPFKVLGMGTDPFGNTKMGVAAETKLNRKDYNINWNKALDAGGVLVGDEVKIDIRAMFIKK